MSVGLLSQTKCEKCENLNSYQIVVDEKGQKLLHVLGLQAESSAKQGGIVIGGPRILAQVEVCKNCKNIRLTAEQL